MRIEKRKAPLDMKNLSKERSVLWVDTLAIPATSKNPDGAHKLINYMLGAKTATEVNRRNRLSTSNMEALKLLPAEITQRSGGIS